MRLAALIGITLSFLVSPVTMAAAPRIIHASAEDCAVLVAAMTSEFGWTRNGPNGPIYFDEKQSDGSIYRLDCPWKSLGVDPPRIADPFTSGLLLHRPSYQPSGLGACVFASDKIYSPPDGTPTTAIAPIDLEKRDGRWATSKVNLGFCIPNH